MKQRLTQYNNIENTTDYTGNFVYLQNNLKYVLTEEGRVVKNGANFEYQYFLKDHLGNTRVTLDATGNILQEDNYYPFGMQMQALTYQDGVSEENKYLYNGKELQKEFGLDWYDYGARFYDAGLGRWFVVDKQADDAMQIDKSPYAYSWDSPIKLKDPDGDCPWCVGALVGAVTDYGIQVAVNFVKGKSFSDALTDIDGGSILISAGAGALSGGLSVLSKTKNASKIVKLVTSEAGEVGVDVAGSVASQLNESGEVSFLTTAIDVTVGKIVGDKVGEVVGNSVAKTNKAKYLARKADRAKRVNAGNPRASRQAKLEKAEKAVVEHTATRVTATSVSTTEIASETVKQFKEILFKSENEDQQ